MINILAYNSLEMDCCDPDGIPTSEQIALTPVICVSVEVFNSCNTCFSLTIQPLL